MSANTMPTDGENTRDGDMTLSAFGGGIPDEKGHPGDYEYSSAIERGQKPWRDREVLVFLRIEEAMSYREIAQEAFDGEISAEGVRQAALRYGIEAERKSDPENLSPRELALRYSPDDGDTEVPEGDDTYTKYTLRGSDK